MYKLVFAITSLCHTDLGMNKNLLFSVLKCSSCRVFFPDVIIKGNLSAETSGDEEEPESCYAEEKYLAELYEQHSSKESKQMRKELQKVC